MANKQDMRIAIQHAHNYSSLASSVLPCNPCGILCNMPPCSQN